MAVTPWGNTEELRARRLSPGPKRNRGAARRNQRERLFAAMVASVETKGYEATRVADLLELSGISRSTFYEHFDDKQDCFAATVKAIVDDAIEIVSRRYDETAGRSAEERARAVFDAFVDLIVGQPAAARLCFVEAYAAGGRARAPMERAVGGFGGLTLRALRQVPGHAGMPAELVRGLIGALYKVFHTRLYRGQVETIPGLAPHLWQWAIGYHPPPTPLRRGRKARNGAASPPSFVAGNPAERIVRALAATVTERGYPGTTIARITERGSISQRTFYAHFDGKEEAMLAALQSSGAQMLGATMPTARRDEDWPIAVRTAIAAMCDFLATEPDFARLRAVEVYAAGPRALEMRDRTGEEMLRQLIAADFEEPPYADAILLEALSGALYALVYDYVRNGGPECLPEMVPLATYITLAPFLGAEAACKVANEEAPQP